MFFYYYYYYKPHIRQGYIHHDNCICIFHHLFLTCQVDGTLQVSQETRVQFPAREMKALLTTESKATSKNINLLIAFLWRTRQNTLGGLHVMSWLQCWMTNSEPVINFFCLSSRPQLFKRWISIALSTG